MELLTPEELAQRWRIKPRTVREMIRTRRLPGLYLGRIVRISLRDVERLERSGQFSWSILTQGPEPRR